MWNPEFEGWYFKHQKGRDTVAFIPGQAKSGAFVQVIWPEGARCFPMPALHVDRKGERVYAPGCRFGRNGISVDLPGIRGEISYGPLTPLRSDIMGPFRFFPMECRHGVLSMGHRLRGSLELPGRAVAAVQRLFPALQHLPLPGPHSLLRPRLSRLHLRRPFRRQGVPLRHLRRGKASGNRPRPHCLGSGNPASGNFPPAQGTGPCPEIPRQRPDDRHDPGMQPGQGAVPLPGRQPPALRPDQRKRQPGSSPVSLTFYVAAPGCSRLVRRGFSPGWEAMRKYFLTFGGNPNYNKNRKANSNSFLSHDANYVSYII